METAIRKTSPGVFWGLALAGAFAGAAWAQPCPPFPPPGPPWFHPFTGPVSKLYVAGINSIYVIQGTSVVATFPMAYGRGDLEGVLAVSETIRTRAADLRWAAGLSGEYTVSGLPTGHSYPTPPTGNLRYYDGTTDGTRNYFVDHGQSEPAKGGVYVADYFWQNPQFSFHPAALCGADYCHGLSGIAYDPVNKSLWISSRPIATIANYSLEGGLLATFDTWPFSSNAGLALDPADHTLWVSGSCYDYQRSIFGLQQYSLDPPTFGQLLQYGAPSGVSGFQGGEFQILACTSPTITALSAALDVLWPPNHKMVPVNVTVATANGCGDVSCKIVSVSSNEPIDPDGDWVINGNSTVNLRAERLGTGNGRVYTITVQCTDAYRNSVSKTVDVSTPHDQGRL